MILYVNPETSDAPLIGFSGPVGAAHGALLPVGMKAACTRGRRYSQWRFNAMAKWFGLRISFTSAKGLEAGFAFDMFF